MVIYKHSYILIYACMYTSTNRNLHFTNRYLYSKYPVYEQNLHEFIYNNFHIHISKLCVGLLKGFTCTYIV